ncbi:hypothetical protein Tco_0634129 [Tanacetum coccineum]
MDLLKEKLSESALRRNKTLNYAVTSFKPVRWKVHISSVRRTMAGVDINTLTMEQYLALSQENKAPGMVKPEIRGNEYHKTRYYYVCSRSLLLDPLKDGWIDSLQELSTLGTSLKKPLSKGIVHNPRPLNDLKTSTTSSKKATNHYTKLGNGPHLDKECPLNEEVKKVDEVKYGEFGYPAPFNGSSGAKFRVGPPGYYTLTDNQTPSGEKRPNLVEIINKYMEEAAKRQAQQDEWLKTFC